MGFDIGATFDAFLDGAKEVAENVQEKTKDIHEKYVSEVIPDFGKYGDEAKFLAEMIPGVAEYNAIKDGDWQGLAISAGISVAALAVGAVTAGAGYAAIKGGSTAAKAGIKVAVKEVAEAGTKKMAKEVAEASTKKMAKEVAEAGTKKVAKEVAEAGTKKVAKEVAEEGTKKVAKETVEAGTKKVAKEVVEEGTEKVAKETAEAGAKKAVKETAEEGVEKVAKEVGDEMDKKLVKDYINQVEQITNREIKTIQLEKIQNALEKQKFTKLDPIENKMHRKDFDSIKNKLINEWEEHVGEKWPVYVEDIFNAAGEVIRRAGQRFDAHHIIESSFNGPNEWWNLQPASIMEHTSIHSMKNLAKKVF